MSGFWRAMREINGCEGNVLMAVGGGQPADSYREAGVDVDAGNALVESIRPLVRATCRPGADGEIGGFGGLFDLKAVGYRDPLLVAANDGVGTKLKIAIETDNHAGVGIDLVAMCVNDLIVQGAEPLFFLDYLASSRLRFDRDRQIIQSIATGCQMAGCALIGGETAEMPGMYMDDDYDLAGFAVGAVERDLLLPRADIAIGDQLLAVPSSGVHSNGFSLIRKIISDHGLCWDSSPGFDPEKTIADIVMTPTRIYVASLLPLLRESVGIKALAHITGGGLIDNIPRILPVGLGVELDLAMLKVPGIFYWLAEMGKIPEKDMLRTFNCGVGMVLVCGRDQASTIIDKLHDAGEAAYPCGQVVEATAASGKIRVNGRLPV